MQCALPPRFFVHLRERFLERDRSEKIHACCAHRIVMQERVLVGNAESTDDEVDGFANRDSLAPQNPVVFRRGDDQFGVQHWHQVKFAQLVFQYSSVGLKRLEKGLAVAAVQNLRTRVGLTDDETFELIAPRRTNINQLLKTYIENLSEYAFPRKRLCSFRPHEPGVTTPARPPSHVVVCGGQN
jgi:hypothetical protein